MNRKRKKKEHKIVEDYKDVRFVFVAGWIMILILAVMLSVPDRRLAIAFLPSLLTMGFFLFRGLREARVYTLFFLLIIFFMSLSLFFLLSLIPFLEIKDPTSLLLLYSPIPVFSILMWRIAAKWYGPEEIKYSIESKRMDLESGTFSPFVKPAAIVAKQLSNKWNRIGLAIGVPGFAGIGATVGFFVEKDSKTFSDILVIICVYVLVPIFVALCRSASAEYSWIHRWEKETGRKMYLAAIVNWKRYQEEQSKLKK